MPRQFFTADLHLGHSRIIDYCKRPYSGHAQMDEDILVKFNSILRPGDLLYILGDVCWSTFDLPSWTSRLNTKELFLIRGNHDKLKDGAYTGAGFRWVRDYEELTLDGIGVCLFHYAQRTWHSKGKGGFQLYGHSHGTLEPGLDRSMDVGVDTHGFLPYSWEEVRGTLSTREIFSQSTRAEFSTGLGAAVAEAIADGTHVSDTGGN